MLISEPADLSCEGEVVACAGRGEGEGEGACGVASGEREPELRGDGWTQVFDWTASMYIHVHERRQVFLNSGESAASNGI